MKQLKVEERFLYLFIYQKNLRSEGPLVSSPVS